MRTRTRFSTVASAAVLVAALAVGGTSSALVAGATTVSSAPRVAHGLNQVPWASVGPRWFLISWTPHPHARHPYWVLVLVSPSGARYDLFRLAAFEYPAAWSGDGRRALLERTLSDGSTQVRTVDLHTGSTLGSFTVPGYATASFSNPFGREVLVSVDRATRVQRLTRYSFAGVAHRSFPGGVSGLGHWTGAWIESPDGAVVVIGYNRGLGVFSNDGALIARLGGHGLSGCEPMRFWSPTVVIAHCSDRSMGFPHVFKFPLYSPTPTALTEEPHGSDLGNFNAWQVGSSTYVQQDVGCGPAALDELDGTVPEPVTVPAFGVGPTEGDVVAAATGTSFAIETQSSCTGQSFLAWWTPSTNSVSQVLGAPVSPGDFGSVIAFPSPSN